MDIKQVKQVILEYLPQNGKGVGNFSTMREFKLSPQEYWPAVTELFNEGLIRRGRGKGGSISLSPPQEEPASAVIENTESIASPKERDNYSGVQNYFTEVWTKLYGIDQYVFEQTSDQGRRNTGGAWTRPDFGLAAVKNFEFIPGRILEIVSIEVKKNLAEAVVGVYETVAHSAFSNRSILVIKIEEADREEADFERITEEAQRFGLGLIVFTNSEEQESFDIVLDGNFRITDPEKANQFISIQFSDGNKKKLRNWVKT